MCRVRRRPHAGKENVFKVSVVPSACATIDSELERIAMAYLERVVGVQLGERRGALGTLERVWGWLRVSSRHPRVPKANL